MVEVSNLSLSDEETSLTFQATPLEFYEGEMLKDFAKTPDLSGHLSDGESKTMSMYVEIQLVPVENKPGEDITCPDGFHVECPSFYWLPCHCKRDGIL